MAELENRHSPSKRWRAARIVIPAVLDDHEVIERHYKLFPDDAGAPVFLKGSLFSADPDDGPETADSVAWRQIAREEIARYAPDELRRLWALRAIKKELGELKRNAHEARFVAQGIGAIAGRYSFPEEIAAQMMRAAGMDLSQADIVDQFRFGQQRALSQRAEHVGQ